MRALNLFKQFLKHFYIIILFILVLAPLLTILNLRCGSGTDSLIRAIFRDAFKDMAVKSSVLSVIIIMGSLLVETKAFVGSSSWVHRIILIQEAAIISLRFLIFCVFIETF